jgi:[glutamine synthetase] adenylyltransferase / [glutamine synthetase]-adenylyl-L-tyrosine phosphorylase
VKARVALIAGLADLGGVWTLDEVTGALTRLADRAVDALIRALVAEEARRGRLPGITLSDRDAGGMVALAMGKMGAGELNYSSDIDLICLFDESRFDAGDIDDARAGFVRVTRRMTAALSDMTDTGYVFRTDLRLRPDASVTPVCLSMGAAEQYYEAQGRTWERAAYIKARACGGDIAAGERFLKVLTPFVWRRHLDYAAIQDAHDMRLRIKEHKGLHRDALEGHDLKLGAGGIREIEFFTQTRQLISGGRDDSLRARATVPALAGLAVKGWLSQDDADELTAAYRAHREVEHRLQMVNDARTHTLPATDDGFDRIARMCGQADTERFRRELSDRLARVAALTEGFFNPGEARGAGTVPREVQAVIDGWRAYPALRSGRAVTIFKRLQPDILSRLNRAANAGEALRSFDAFLAGLPAGVQLFSLFEANPQLIDLIVDICATAPGLAAYLARNAGVLDAVIGGDFFTAWPGEAALAASFRGRMAGAEDYERKLGMARVWLKEWHFRIGVHHLRGLTDAAGAGREYADLARACLSALWPVVAGAFAARHGPLPGRGAVVVAMGSLGAGRLHAASDLDLIVICDPGAVEMSDGPKPLASRVYFARLTQALVTALTAPMAEGRLYDVDMRLRPSGRQGPVAVTLTAFRDYQMTEAWTWEHLALTRARVVAGDAGLARDVEDVRCAVLRAKGNGAGVLADTAEMRARIFAAKPPDGASDAKVGPGRLQDIELLAQAAALCAGDPAQSVADQLEAGLASGFLTADDAAALLSAHGFLWRLQAVARLLTDKPLDMATLGEGGRAFLLRETGMPDMDALASRLADLTVEVAGIVTARLDTDGGRSGDGEEDHGPD